MHSEKLLLQIQLFWGTAVAQWLMCCAKNRKVAGSITAGVSGFFIDIKSFRSTQLLTEISKGKGKAVPLQAWSGPEGSRKLRFPDYMTTAQDGGKVVSLTHRPPLPPGNAPGTHFC